MVFIQMVPWTQLVIRKQDIAFHGHQSTGTSANMDTSIQKKFISIKLHRRSLRFGYHQKHLSICAFDNDDPSTYKILVFGLLLPSVRWLIPAGLLHSELLGQFRRFRPRVYIDLIT